MATSKTRINRLNQAVVDVKKARARDTISNVISQQKRANMWSFMSWKYKFISLTEFNFAIIQTYQLMWYYTRRYF